MSFKWEKTGFQAHKPFFKYEIETQAEKIILDKTMKFNGCM